MRGVAVCADGGVQVARLQSGFVHAVLDLLKLGGMAALADTHQLQTRIARVFGLEWGVGIFTHLRMALHTGVSLLSMHRACKQAFRYE